MRYLLTIVLLLMATSSSAVLTKTYTVCESGCDYTSVQAAETAHEQNLVTNDSALTFEIQNTWASPDGETLVSGWTTDATRFLTITAVGAARATATWSTTAYRAILSGTPFNLSEEYTVLDGIQAEPTTNNVSAVNIASTASNSTVKNCFLNGGGLSGVRALLLNSSSLTGIIIRNNVMIDCPANGLWVNSAGASGVTADNNTIENCAIGISTSSGDTKARNNIIWNCTTPISGNFVNLSQENYTDAASLNYGTCGDCGTGDQLSQSVPFIDVGGENYHLALGAAAIDAGKDLSGDFTDDIDGQTRGANFDKGADEFGQVTIISGTTDIEDTWMNTSGPGLNYGVNTALHVVTTLRSALIRPKNLSTEIPADATITKATFRLFCELNSTDGATDAYSVFKPWEEGTQNIADCANPGTSWDDWDCDDSEWRTAGCECADDDGVDNTSGDVGTCEADGTNADRKATAESSVNVTTVDTWYEWTISNALAQAWYDGTKNEEGIILISALGSNRFTSTEGSSGNLPYFTFEYTLTGGSALITGADNIDDTFIKENVAANNFGSSTSIETLESGGVNYNILIRAKNLSSFIPAGATITNAVCSLFVFANNSDGDMAAYRVFKPWVEGTQDNANCVTAGATSEDWDCDGFEWTTPNCECINDDGVDNSDDDGDCDDATRRDRKSTAESTVNVTTVSTWYSWDISNELAQGWYDGTINEEGLVFVETTAGGNNAFRSTEYSVPAQQPRFVFTYTLAAAGGGQNIMIRK